jgi:hypothetical protein
MALLGIWHGTGDERTFRALSHKEQSMRKLVTSLAVVFVFLVAVAAWAFGQRGNSARDNKPPGPPYIKRPLERQSNPVIERPHHIDRLFLIDDVDKEAQREAARERAAQHRAARQAALKQTEAGPVGRYALSSSEKCSLLVDTVTGKTWLLCPSAGGRPCDAAWLPIERIDDRERALRWIAEQEVLKEHLKKERTGRRKSTP